MRVVADSQAIYWYLNEPERLPEKALRWLEDAEQGEGIVVSAATVPELWIAATRKRGIKAVPQTGYDILKGALLDPTIAIDAEPLTASTWPYFEVAAGRLRDPFDAFIVATALALDVSLVSADKAIRDCGLVHVVW